MFALIDSIAEYLFGHKYYTVVLENPFIFKGDETQKSMSGYIFRDKETAKSYYYIMKTARSVKSVELISFRSRNYYEPMNSNYLNNKL